MTYPDFYPYPGFFCEEMDQHIQCLLNGNVNGSTIHMVVGDGHIDQLWTAPDKEAGNFLLDWFCWKNGTALLLTDKIKTILSNNKTPLFISAPIWQNSIGKENLDVLKQCVMDILAVWRKNPQHCVAFPTVSFVPEQQEFWDDVQEFNDYLSETNIMMGLQPYHLHKVLMTKKKNKGFQVKNNAWAEFVNGTGRGFKIALSHYQRYSNFIKSYHSNNAKFSSSDSQKVAWASKYFETPEKKACHPRDIDLRQELNDRKANKMNQQIEQNSSKFDKMEKDSAESFAKAQRSQQLRLDMIGSAEDTIDKLQEVAHGKYSALQQKKRQLEDLETQIKKKEAYLQNKARELHQIKMANDRQQRVELERRITIKRLKKGNDA